MFQIPNHTQAPNTFFDDIAKTLKEGELRILLVIMRQTFGWGKPWDRISLSQLERKTGMSRTAVSESLNSLTKSGIIRKKKIGNTGKEKCFYTLLTEEQEKALENDPDKGDSIDDSSNSYRSSKTTPPSSLKLPTKDTLTKETQKKIEKEKLPRSARKPAAAPIILNQKTKQFEGIAPEDIQTWQNTFPAVNVRKEISECQLWALSTHRGNYRKSIDKWMSNVNNKHTTPYEKKEELKDQPEKNKALAEKVCEKFPAIINKNEIQIQETGLLFSYGQVYEFIEFSETSFKSKVFNRLKRMNLDVSELQK